jgi:segregation and condensation protein A
MMVENGWSKDDVLPYTVRLEMFEGPLDLLLHLINKNELDITNISIALITEQYLEYLKLMKILNLDVAGEYLLMASTLLHIKSKMLLPGSSEEEEEEGEDPRAELVRRLLEYQKYKEAAIELERRPMLDRDVFIRSAPVDTEEPSEEERIEVSLFELLEAFRQMLEKAKPEAFHEVILERITVEEKLQEILLLLQKEKRSMAFHLLFSDQTSRRVIVITFLAILELVKMKRVRIFQVAPFETIRLSLV